MVRIPVALQLYTVRQACEVNFVSTLKIIADIGYAGVELTGDGGLGAAALNTVLVDQGLKVAGCHVSLANLETDLNRALDMNEAVGNTRIVCPWIPPEKRETEEDYRTLARNLTKIGGDCRSRGFQLYYHHHDFEFKKFSGVYALDMLLNSVPDGLMKAELDTYWIEAAGENAADFIRSHASQVDLVHLKDRLEHRDPPFAEVGEGSLDFPEIFRACEEAQVHWYIVEQDRCPGDEMASARRSFRNLTMWGKA